MRHRTRRRILAGLSVALLAAAGDTPARADEAMVGTLATDEELLSNGRLGGVSVGPRGEIYVSNFGRSLWRVETDGRVVKLLSSLQGASGNAVDRDGNVYQASFVDGRIVKVTPRGRVIPWVEEGLSGPVGLALDPRGALYAVNCKANTVSRISPRRRVERFAQSEDFDCPNGIAAEGDGQLVVVSFKNGKVVRLSPDGAARTIADVPEGGNAHVAVVGGSLLVTKIEANRVYAIDPGGAVRPFAGSGTLGLEDGPALVATLARPNGIAVSPDGRTVYLNNLDGPWRGSEITRIVLRTIRLPSGFGGADGAPGGRR